MTFWEDYDRALDERAAQERERAYAARMQDDERMTSVHLMQASMLGDMLKALGRARENGKPDILDRQIASLHEEARRQKACEDFDEADRAAITADDNLLLTMTVTTKAGNTRTYRFYPYSDRRVYYTVNGEGEFYVNRTMIDKVISDVRRVQSGETVDSETRY